MSFGRMHDRRLALDAMAKDADAVRLYERLGRFRIGETLYHYGAGKAAHAFCCGAPGG
ncbi:acetyltransferase [Streptomyces pimonensis]|uniref:Acetyltransferase n=2 Tax=Streptomyces pimonensis TaxID=2860288 RepID=A0ABV4IZH9_9ACTN